MQILDSFISMLHVERHRLLRERRLAPSDEVEARLRVILDQIDWFEAAEEELRARPATPRGERGGNG